MPTYRVTDKTTGIEWEANGQRRRVESGETADDIPAEGVASLLAQELIEEVSETKAAAVAIPEDGEE